MKFTFGPFCVIFKSLQQKSWILEFFDAPSLYLHSVFLNLPLWVDFESAISRTLSDCPSAEPSRATDRQNHLALKTLLR